MADVDFAAVVRGLRTSDLIATTGDQTQRVTLPDLPGPDAVVRGLEKLRNESRSVERAEHLDEAIARIEADARELAKADRRTAEQERIITAQREKLEALRAALTEACNVAEFYCDPVDDDDSVPSLCMEHAVRIAELRKLTEAP